MNGYVSPSRIRQRGIRLATAAALLASLLFLAGTSSEPAKAAPPYCDGPKPRECLPTPAECATGRYNGSWRLNDHPSAVADCAGYQDATGQRHLVHYVAGDTNPNQLCGLAAENDRLVAGGYWQDPNRCFTPPPPPGVAAKGTRYRNAVTGAGGVVASISQAASEAGLEMLRSGGNAIDAAVAMVFAVGVTNPETCGIGGGGFLVARMADGEVRALDFRETAPAAMQADSLQPNGINRWGTGHRVVGVPGTVAGMDEALRELGTKTLHETIMGTDGSTAATAWTLASQGVEVSMSTANEYVLSRAHNGGPTHEERLRRFPEAARIYLHNGYGYFPGAILRQSDYARSLRIIAEHGRDAFYLSRQDYPEGKSVGALIAEEMERSRQFAVATPERPDLDGDRALMTAQDLATYRPVWREPLRSTYRGHEVLSMPPPNAGGIQVQEMLNILESSDLAALGHSSADWLHVLVEAQKIARADRDGYVGDPDVQPVPTAELTDQGYANRRAKEIDMSKAQEFSPGAIPGYEPYPTAPVAEGQSTTHVSVIDRDGNAVAVTCTIEQAFGSAVVAFGTGFLLNNQLSDFSSAGTVNEPGPGKRPRSNTSPTIVVRGGRPVLVLGAMGGPRIPLAVAHVITNVVDFGMDVAHAVDAARGYAEDRNEQNITELRIEATRLPKGRDGLSVVEALQRKGHPVIDAGEYFPTPIMQIAVEARRSRSAMSDTRSDYGAAVQER